MTDERAMSRAKWTEFRLRMPLLLASEGVWEGWYRHYDAKTGALKDQHRSRLFCRIMDEGSEFPYHQTNHYFWEDGRREVREFPAWYHDGRIWWEDLITGWAAPMKPDDHDRSTCLNWTRKDEPDMYLYEMIQHSEDGRARSRVWQWFKGDRCFQRTLIDEVFVTRDWKGFTADGPPKL